MPTKKSVKQMPQQMVGFGKSVANFWKKYGSFGGTAQRSEYWWVVLFMMIVCLPFEFITMMFAVVSYEAAIAISILLYGPWLLATIIPTLSLLTRRFHDAGFSAAWIFVPMLINFVFLPLMMLFGVAFDDFSIVAAFGILWYLSVSGFGVFYFVVSLLPSKLKNNPYRK